MKTYFKSNYLSCGQHMECEPAHSARQIKCPTCEHQLIIPPAPEHKGPYRVAPKRAASRKQIPISTNPVSFFSRPALAVGVWLLAAVSAWAQPLRIMPIGDSITYGFPVAGGYRAPLYRLLTNAGYSVDFVGTQTGNSVASLPDPNHEGYNGWRISQIDSNILNVFNAVPDPDIILLLLGTNDYGQNNDPANATNRLEALIAKMATNRPNAKIIVANLLVRGEPFNTQIQNTFNPFLPSICERQRALGRQVYFNDLRRAVLLSDMPDNLHPNQLGYDKMATNWFVAVQAVLCTNCPPRFTLQPTNQLVLPGTNVSLVASAIGTGPIRYQWRFEGTNILNATNAGFSFTNASLTNGHGNFSVAVTDDIGTTISTNALVFMRIKPVIVTHPVAQTVLQGQNATFTCLATGAPPIFYRWLRSGVSIFTNTTGIGLFTNVQSSLADSIRCVVMNAAGAMNGSNQGCVKLVRKVKLGLGLERFFGTIDLEYCWLGGCQSQNECRTETNKPSWMNWK